MLFFLSIELQKDIAWEGDVKEELLELIWDEKLFDEDYETFCKGVAKIVERK